MMQIVHVGNVANIAYLTVKFLRERRLTADVYIPDRGLPAVSFPEWEEGDFDPSEIDWAAPDWRRVRMRNGWTRPSWVKRVPDPMWQRLPFSGEDPFVGQCEARLNTRLAWQNHRLTNESLKRRGLPELEFTETTRMFDVFRWERIVRDYDVVVAYGAEPINCLVDFPRKPYIAVDYGSPLRTMIWGESELYNSRLLRASYEWADWVVLTNPDVQPVAEQLGLRYRFIPHPVDEGKFRPGPSAARQELERRFGEEVVVLFSPARQNWKIKGNDKMIRGVARVIQEAQQPVILLLPTWGEDVDRSRSLIRREGIEKNVVWQPMSTKVQLVDWYRAADIVLDQFTVGTFGLITAEAMACGKPVVLNFKPEVHRWCFPELPPVVSAAEEEEIFQEVSKLVRDKDRRETLGQGAHEWFLRYHSSDVVAERHVELYRRLLRSRAVGQE